MASASPPELLQKPHDHDAKWLLRKIWDLINERNEHFMGVIVGKEGSGKSHTAIRIASEVDPTFTSDRIIFDVSDLLKILKDGDHSPGNFYVLDEAGVQLGRRTWQERGQVLANQALQLIRNHNLGLLFTLPRLTELDSQTQGRLQAFYELVDKEPEEFVRGKWKWMDPDRSDTTGKIYKKYPRRRRNGAVLRITSVAFRPPDPSLIEPYEARKRKFQDAFYEETIRQLDGVDEEESDNSKNPKDVVDEIVDSGIEEVLATNQQTGEEYVSKDLIRVEFGTSHDDARAVKTLLEKQNVVGI